ncbi:class I adenylate-forming enzyme family protein [Sphingomonas sp.]|jgi:acyl-CoA synthetase (AMP-forming)/AMP-acid ligase II|uniref:class I adenylate-forming enzyme family protein n=1 Tax=Sphingomonas sp. TaxID=28214 RepID=UPI002D8072FE|nr:class I adenylate-forming enzyme family protein [Sphingomonas sp.]HEU0043092.1 class I adenylate-forming enzyme family protein [Sphingomonas sp.]
MPSQLDQRMTATMAALTGPGGMLPVATVPSRWGVALPLITAAPPSLAHYMAHYAHEHGDKTFLVAGPERLTFAETYAVAVRVAQGLVAHGVKKGDRVGIAMRNSPSWIATYMGVVIAGGVATLLNGWWQTEEMAAAVHDVECSLIVADGPRCKRLAAIAHLPALFEIDDLRPLAQAMAPLCVDRDVALPEIGSDDWATILFTSGSTGLSKGAISTHRAVVQGVFNFLASAMMMMGLATQDGNPPQGQPATLLNVPLFHVTAEVPVFLQSFAMGRKLVLMPKWDAEEAMRLIQQEQVSYFVGVPLMSYEILNHPRRGDYDLSTVTDFAAGGAPRPPEHVQRIKDEMGGGAPLIGYGLTETNGVGTGNWRENYLAKPNSAGLPSKPLSDLAILDEAGKPVATGARGEVGLRTIANFSEYWGKPEATAAAFTADGYFLTGDIGYVDEDGYLFIVDRKKDIIIRGGENISCQEVEAALYQHPAVAEVAVFGLADEKFGEVPGAVVHPADGAVLDEAGLQAFLSEHIAAFKVPARIWLSATALPRLGTEKIDKVGLRKTFREVWAGEH